MSTLDDDEAEIGTVAMFEEPQGYYQPEKQPTTVSHTTLSGLSLSLRLIGHSPLWVGVLIYIVTAYSNHHVKPVYGILPAVFSLFDDTLALFWTSILLNLASPSLRLTSSRATSCGMPDVR